MRRLCATVQSTEATVERELHMKAICHALLSFICFETGSDVDDKSRSVYYHISNFPGLEFELDISRTELDKLNMMVTLQWRRRNADWQLGGSWTLCFETFFRTNVVLPSKFDEIEDTGFLSSTRYVEFKDSMQAELLRPLWDSIREHFPSTDTEALERSLALIEEAKTLMSNQHGTEEERGSGMEKLRESVRGLPWKSRSLSIEEIKEDAYRFQLNYVIRNKRP
ncbi:hypothetical protein ARMSODRAFT_1084125 [Armillaria solidipes]|uniref:Uncharacterized protein n=1 Tax=Armillaria solidipes TaxID=1076256 RepID=A0A2H3BWY4_9AGAR|nr:hypothetical protein ARMSODRAFT_1084125 [Armillaria solidipes]